MGTYHIDYGYHKDKRIAHFFVSLVLLGFAGVSGYFVYSHPKSAPALSQTATAQDATEPNVKLTKPVAWPGYGQAAYGVIDSGVLASSTSKEQAVPIASLAKVITALAVLEKKPLKVGEQGPMITITQADIDIYQDYVRKGGTVVPVELGGQISQRDAMQAMLMPSANNMADLLARWAFGSVDEYNKYANKMVRKMNLTSTTVSDASGYSSATVSTAHDMTQLGMAYMQNPLLVEIAKLPGATIPFAGAIQNYNATHNKDGFMGIKMGNTDEAGRCFMAADTRNGIVSVVTVLGANRFQTAMTDAETVISSGNAAYDQAKSR